MGRRRRDILATGAALATLGVAGCNGLSGGDDTETDAGTTTDGTDDPSDGNGSDGNGGTEATVEAAVAAEWNAMRARVWDAVALGTAGSAGAGASVAQSTFARFEGATGEYGAHEALERTSESNYAEFEEALGELQSAGLQAGDLDRAREEASIASTQLSEAQRALVGESAGRRSNFSCSARAHSTPARSPPPVPSRAPARPPTPSSRASRKRRSTTRSNRPTARPTRPSRVD